MTTPFRSTLWTISLLFSKGLCAEQKNFKFFSACHFSGKTKLHKIENLLKENPKLIDVVDEDGNTPLHHVALCDYYDRDLRGATDILLKAKADPNARNYSGQTPLHHITRWTYDPTDLYFGNANRWPQRDELHAVVIKLLRQQADPLIKDRNLKTAIDLARQARIQQVDDGTIRLLEFYSKYQTKVVLNLAKLLFAGNLRIILKDYKKGGK